MMITESKRDDFLNSYIELLASKGIKTTLSQLKSYLLSKFSAEFGMYALSKPSNYFLAGVARYYFEGLLTSNKRLNVFYPNVTDKPIVGICTRLNALVEILRNAYIDSVGTKFEQPEDFGTLPLDKLLKKYNKKIDAELGVNVKPTTSDKPKIDTSTKAGKKYTYEIIYNYNQAERFNQYTKPGAWCITYGKQHYNAYIKKLGIHYVVFMQNGFENVERKIGKGFSKEKPHDEYGNSLICVLQDNKSPKPIYITSRWNHGYGPTQGTEADHAYTTEEFLKVIGCDYSVLERCYEQWKENRKNETSVDRSEKNKEKLSVAREFKYLEMMIANGANLKEELIKRKSGNVFLINPTNVTNKANPWKMPLLVGLKSPQTDNLWYTIYDRGHFFVDKVLFEDLYTRPKAITKDVSSIPTPDGNKCYLYNTKRHCFVDANGTILFRYNHSLFYDLLKNEKIVMRISSQQVAVFDATKGEFLKGLRGEQIFERVQVLQSSNNGYDSQEKSFHNILNNNGVLYLTYDSSAMISYLFDLETNKFIKNHNLEPTKNGEVWMISKGINNIPNYTIYVSVPPSNVNAPRYGIVFQHKSCYVAYSNIDDSKLSILGSSEFSYLSCHYDNIIAFRPYNIPSASQFGDTAFFYDTETNSIIKDLNEKPIFCRDMYDYQSGFLFLPVDGYGWQRVLVYNNYTKKLVNKDNAYVFYFRGADGKDVRLSKPDDLDTVFVVNAKKDIDTFKESVKRDFYNLLHKI